MSEKPEIDIRRFEPKKISAKYWMKFLLYALILAALFFWYKQKSKSRVDVKAKTNQHELDFKDVKIEDANFNEH